MFKKIISSVLIAGQIGFTCSAMAMDSTSTAVTPELTLLSNSLAIAGQKISQEDANNQLKALFTEYEKTAQPEGQTERLEQALVSLNLYTANDAHQLTVDAQALDNSIATGSSAASTEMSQILSKYPAGAQFGGCGLGTIIMVTGSADAITGFVYWGMHDSSNTHDQKPDVGGEHVGEIVAAAGIAALVDGIIVFALGGGCQ